MAQMFIMVPGDSVDEAVEQRDELRGLIENGGGDVEHLGVMLHPTPDGRYWADVGCKGDEASIRRIVRNFDGECVVEVNTFHPGPLG